MCINCNMRYPYGKKISDLEPGDEIILKEGYGYPKAKENTVHIIVAVDGLSALTADGTRLSCFDGIGITTTGKNFSDFVITKKAKEILEKIEKKNNNR